MSDEYFKNEKTARELVEEFKSGLEGNGFILWHKKPHKNGSGEFACVLGLQEGCSGVINCPNCYIDNLGGYCLERNGKFVDGFLAVESKHSRLIEEGIPGAYKSISEAVNSF